MADNTTLNAGSGGDTIATDDLAGVKHQRVKVEFGADGSATDVSAANPLPVAQTGALPAGTNAIGKLAANSGVDIGDVDVTSSALPTGAATSAKQPALGTAGSASTDVLTVQGIASMTPVKTDGSGVTQPVSGTVTANLAAGTNNIGDVDVLTLPSIPAGTNNIGDVDVLTIAAGTNAIGNVGIVPRTTGGFTTYHLVSAGSTNATNVKASAGQLFGWFIYNSNAAARKLVFHNTAGTPTAGASVFFSIVIPPTSAANVFTETGIAFSTGIGITTVTGLADSDSAAVAANDLVINLFYA